MKKTIINIIYFLFCLGIFLLFLKFISFKVELGKEELKNEKINGIVDTVFYDKSDHNSRIFVVNHKEYPCDWYQSDSIYIGDSVCKRKGEFNLKIIKKDSKKVIDCWYAY